MTTPFLAHNLATRRTAVEDEKLVTSVGWVGDPAHQAECSDHNPDAIGDVHAIDCMTLVLASQKAIVQWALSAPADLEYVINQRTIWTRSNGWRPAKYTGTDPHTNHVHISGKHGISGNVPHVTCTGYDRAAEKITPEGFNVALTQANANLVVATLVKDTNFQALIWRTKALLDNGDVEAGPTKGEENKLAKAVATPAPPVVGLTIGSTVKLADPDVTP